MLAIKKLFKRLLEKLFSCEADDSDDDYEDYIYKTSSRSDAISAGGVSPQAMQFLTQKNTAYLENSPYLSYTGLMATPNPITLSLSFM